MVETSETTIIIGDSPRDDIPRTPLLVNDRSGQQAQRHAQGIRTIPQSLQQSRSVSIQSLLLRNARRRTDNMLQNRTVRLFGHHRVGTQLVFTGRIPDRPHHIRTITTRIIFQNLERRHHTLIKRRNRRNGTYPIRDRQNRRIPTVNDPPRRTPFRTILYVRKLLKNAQQRLIRRLLIRPITANGTRSHLHRKHEPVIPESTRHKIPHNLTLVTIRIHMILHIHAIQIMFHSHHCERQPAPLQGTFTFDDDTTPQYRRTTNQKDRHPIRDRGLTPIRRNITPRKHHRLTRHLFETIRKLGNLQVRKLSQHGPVRQRHGKELKPRSIPQDTTTAKNRSPIPNINRTHDIPPLQVSRIKRNRHTSHSRILTGIETPNIHTWFRLTPLTTGDTATRRISTIN